MLSRALTCSLLALWLTACGVTEPPIERLLVTVSLSQPAMTPGDSMTITVRATNVTDSDVEFSSNSCVLVPQVLDSAGREVYPGGVACLDILLVHRLAPGEQLEEVFDFYGWGRRDVDGGHEEYPLPAGTYRVRGALTMERENPSEPVPLLVRDTGP